MDYTEDLDGCRQIENGKYRIEHRICFRDNPFTLEETNELCSRI